MPPAADPRKVVGGVVHALARHVTNDAECHRRYGHFSKTKMVPGVVLNVQTPRVKNRAKVIITARFDLGGGSAESMKILDLNLRSVHKGPPPGTVPEASEANQPDLGSGSAVALEDEAGHRQGGGRLTVRPSMPDETSSGLNELGVPPGALHLPPTVSVQGALADALPPVDHSALIQAPVQILSDWAAEMPMHGHDSQPDPTGPPTTENAPITTPLAERDPDLTRHRRE